MGEMVGSGISTTGIGSQLTHHQSADNLFYNPSFLAWSDQTSYSINYSLLQTDFKKIKSVELSTDINSGETSKIGDLNPNKDSMQKMVSVHFLMPFIESLNAKLGISLLTPGDKITEVDTGDSYRPEYVMYNSRINRTTLNINYIQAINQYFSFSIGFINGFKSYGEAYFVARNPSNDPDLPSSGKMAFSAKPITAASLSLTYKINPTSTLGFSYTDELKSTFKSDTTGISFIGTANLAFDWDMMSLLYYDPRISRFQYLKKFDRFELSSSLEYQDWSGYETPVLNLDAQGGAFNSSIDNTNFKVKNTLNPKIGFRYAMNDKNTVSFGYQYKQSPLELIDDRAGNSIDLDSHILASSFEHSLFVDGSIFNIGFFAQYHSFKNQTVKKGGNKENATAGDKIGFPSYKVGGNAYAFGIGINWTI